MTLIFLPAAKEASNNVTLSGFGEVLAYWFYNNVTPSGFLNS